ncbi:YbaB/EbfC family nucleoid-associated protein [Jiangella rhizosphaerae]|uniref:Nucleoid-associated protein DY240_15910 n=1 Tax=Jiangella rhizosphaerae TaxID=2293569 RepID=A0A418KPJ9_9ACTN|nr:YbaB/EbfC family nucleoid-associated protein [Jiangella rhizosphaerae]RIQ21038.1 YbaB/EbfC family nucleoid-associated protein [Jiangella rhizosphaerae]
MSQLLQQAQRMQEQLLSAQQDLTEAEATGSAGGGLVRATVTGAGELTDLQLDPSVVDPDDVETLADLIIAAVRDAHAEIQRRANEQLGAINADVAGLLGGQGGGAAAGAPGGQDTIRGEIEGDDSGDDRPSGQRG